ncbi:RNA polymerase sigma factor [Roseateles flavus]|uniref:Sigma factor-like helix-turn-helix DNA-binding protein n=1 Tax=Roseateles flavus TaxID=3149041 RepID=A0ABV0G8X1_9BURK
MIPAAVDEADVDIDADDAESLKSYQRLPEHELWLAKVFKMDGDQLLAALAIKKHTQAGYLPSEVLVTLARNGYGGSARVRNAIAIALNERLVIGFKGYLNRHLKWFKVVTRSSEAQVEGVAYVRERIFRSRAEVSFAEARFGMFVGMRLLDWFKSQTALKNKAPSVDGELAPKDEDGNQLSLADQVPDEVGLTPEAALQQKQLFASCRSAVLSLPDKQRTAVLLCFHQNMTHKEAGKVMGLGESSVQKYVMAALNALRNGDWHD